MCRAQQEKCVRIRMERVKELIVAKNLVFEVTQANSRAQEKNEVIWLVGSYSLMKLFDEQTMETKNYFLKCLE